MDYPSILWGSFAFSERSENEADLAALDEIDYTLCYAWENRLGSFDAGYIVYTLANPRSGRALLMNVQSNEVTAKRVALYRKTMAEAGYDEAAIAQNMDNVWIWRNIVAAETDTEAEAVG